MTRVSVTVADLLDALDAARPNKGPSEARTLNELMEQFEVRRDKMLDAVRALKQQGRLTVVYVQRESVIGAAVRVPAYIIAPAPKATRNRGK